MHSAQDISQDKTLLWLMALSCGLTAGANYFSQPLIYSIQQAFQGTTAQAQLTVTFAQLSYALGLLFLVPLGDIVNRTKFIPLLMALAGVGLLICATAVNLPMLWIGTAIAGLFSVAAQVLIPFAAMTVKPEKMGETVGFLMSGLLVGIYLSTSLAGILSNLFHWQVIYIVSAILIFACAYFLRQKLPHAERLKMKYAYVFISMKHLVLEEPRLILRALMGAFAFASLSILFSTIAVYLSSPPFELEDTFIGMVSLVGILGALSSKYVGQWADRGYNIQLSFLGGVFLLLSWVAMYFSSHGLIFYIIGFAVVNLGLAFVHSCNQNIIYRIRPDAKSRINAIYMTFYFGGAAFGSAIGIFSWNYGGWSFTCLIGVILSLIATGLCFVDYARFARHQTVNNQQ